MLTAKKISMCQEDYGKVRALFLYAFPANERYPLWLLRILSMRQCVDFVAFYDKSTFCGFTYLIHYQNLTFILYLAIDDRIRSKGYGSQALEWIKEQHAQHGIVLNIETLTPSDNYEQRVKRFRFYEKNEFYDTGYFAVMGHEKCQTLFCGAQFRPERYERLVNHFSFGLVKEQLQKANT